MLTIICGEDTVKSREYYLSLKQQYRNKKYEIIEATFSEILEMDKWLTDSPSLFSQQCIFFTQGLNKKISKRANPAFFTLVEQLVNRKEVNIVDWEEYTPGRELKISRGVIVKEFKLSQSIFKLLDSCYPGNLKLFIYMLHELPEKIDGTFIFIMLSRHMRNLLAVKSGVTLKSLQTWQQAKLKYQAKNWELDKLTGFYDSLHRIDVSIKTSNNPFSVKDSLDTLACYFL